MIRQIKNINDDINRIMDIWLKSTIEAHKFISKEYWERNYEIVKNIYIPQSKTYVYIKNEEILGFISILNQEFIGALFVDIDFQNTGIGKKLIEFVKQKYKKLSLAVYKENVQALEFYRKNGFICSFEQINEDTGISEYIMTN